MIDKGYYLTSKNWSYTNVLIDYFLEDIEDELTLKVIQKNIKVLENYRNGSSDYLLTLTFGNYTLKIKGSDEATSTIRGLEYISYKINLQKK